MIQLNVASVLDYATCVSTTPGWAAHQTKTTVLKEPALAQLLELVTLTDVKKKCSEYMLVGGKMEK